MQTNLPFLKAKVQFKSAIKHRIFLYKISKLREPAQNQFGLIQIIF